MLQLSLDTGGNDMEQYLDQGPGRIEDYFVATPRPSLILPLLGLPPGRQGENDYDGDINDSDNETAVCSSGGSEEDEEQQQANDSKSLKFQPSSYEFHTASSHDGPPVYYSSGQVNSDSVASFVPTPTLSAVSPVPPPPRTLLAARDAAHRHRSRSPVNLTQSLSGEALLILPSLGHKSARAALRRLQESKLSEAKDLL
jgi:hypothetical protein